ncbi:trypsin-like serine peptidase [Ferirhizobium litorale]|uniref:Serine protease n=1 Tax=Ferirhizobium litorale TaxID=2927786 RepID=A0AAE3QCU0_9HYPH|nr:serine protease [Fererhizobium litorale]MDI7923422.1 serine protease [Fererhizobium litorale]
MCNPILIIASVLSLLLEFTACLAEEALADGVPDPKFSNINLSQFAQEQLPSGPALTFHYSRPGSRYIRIHLRDISIPKGYLLTITGDAESPDYVLSGPASFKELYPPLATGGTVKIQISGTEPTQARLTVANIIPQQTNPNPWLSIFEGNQLANINIASKDIPLVRASRSVVFLSFEKEGENKVCSGFVISRNTIITNNHCIDDVETCKTADIVFDYTKDDRGNIVFGDQRRCLYLVEQDKILDYSILQVDQPIAEEYAPLQWLTTQPSAALATKLIQHPAGEWKQISEIGCEILEVGVPGVDLKVHSDLTHRCDTIGGSSGSPLLAVMGAGASARYCVVGLHHWGFDQGTPFFATRNRAVMAQLLVKSLLTKGVEFNTCN